MKYFKLSEFDCKETGENQMAIIFLLKMDELRHVCGFPFYITSGYRSPKHSIESKKDKPGTHSKGIAADVAITCSNKRFIIVEKALSLGFKGIGVHNDFIHLDTRKDGTLWLYS